MKLKEDEHWCHRTADEVEHDLETHFGVGLLVGSSLVALLGGLIYYVVNYT